MKKNPTSPHSDSNFRKKILRSLTTLGKDISDLAEIIGFDPGSLEKVLKGQTTLSFENKNLIDRGIEQLAMISAAKKPKE